MCSASDGDAAENDTQQQPRPEGWALTRRGLMLGGAVSLLAACVRSDPSSRQGIWYQVQAGDSLSSLSRRTRLPIETIVEANDLTSRTLLPGRRLWLPGITMVGPDPDVKPVETKSPVQVAKPAQPPATDNGHYELVPRSAWTTEPVGINNLPMDKVLRITVHHTSEHDGMEGLSDLEVIRRIERYHRGPEKRWAAIGYHYLVGKDSKIYEGRPVRFQGAHVSAKNENNLGISVIGDGHTHLPSPKQLSALKAFLDDQRERFSVTKDRVYGHRELKPTICPGDMLMAWVKSYRANAK